MKSFDWKKIAPYLVALVVFLCFAVLYCSPVLNGKVLYAGDVNNWKGAAQEVREYYRQTGETSWWTNSMFGGMPTYQISGTLPSGKMRGDLANIMHAGFTGDIACAGIIFAYFFGFFLMLICFGINPWLSIVGGFALGLSSYFMLIIPAGHMTKAVGLGFLAPMIGGFYAAMRRKYWLGVPLILLYGFLGLTSHPQMSYYIALLIAVMACAELYIHIRDKQWKELGVSVGTLVLCLLLVLGTKWSWMDMNQSYLKQTMRGGHSELTQNDTTSTSKVGLDLTYATDWSYGKAETMTLLIPNWEGGASGYNVGKDSQLCQTMRKKGVAKRDAEQFCKQVPTYHGEKAFTSGPIYIGAIICFLFLLGLLIVPGPYKWALLFATLMSVFLAWGKNMMWLTELFFNYFPMYNKFRAVESILVVAEITMPLLAFMGLQRIVEEKVEWKNLKSSLWIAGAITAGLCLYAALFAGSFDMHSSYDEQWTSKMPEWLVDAIMDERVAMVKADAWRSLLFVLLGFALTYWYAWKQTKNQKSQITNTIFFAGLAVLILCDMVPVDRRFFSTDAFVLKREMESFFKTQPYEEQIVQDTTLDYRVLNLTTSTFNDSRTSYRLKSIGGYSAVKLRRYQDLIEAHLVPEMNALYQTIYRTNGFAAPDEKQGADYPVLNMLNMRYAVVGLQDGTSQPIRNPYAMGNAWFVDNVHFVPTADDESAALNTIDLHKTAVADEKFRDVLTCQAQPDSTDVIELTTYEPDHLIYHTRCSHDRVVIFSEIYYPEGWHLYIDEEEKELGRANYILRAAIIPSGEHTITMKFVPKALDVDKWSYACAILLLLIALGAISWPWWKRCLPSKAE